MLRDTIALYTELSGNDGEHTPIVIIGAYLDGYDKGREDRPQGEWIPVSEKLPTIDAENGWKASDVVLVYLADGNMHMGFYCEDKKWRFCESGEAKEPFMFDVIAWMPLPKPYKKEKEPDEF